VTSLGVHNDFAPGQASVRTGASQHKTLGGIDDLERVAVELLRGHNLLDLCSEYPLDVLVGDIRCVLVGDQNGVCSEGDELPPLVFILEGHLGLGVRPQPRTLPRFSFRRQLLENSMAQL